MRFFFLFPCLFIRDIYIKCCFLIFLWKVICFPSTRIFLLSDFFMFFYCLTRFFFSSLLPRFLHLTWYTHIILIETLVVRYLCEWLNPNVLKIQLSILAIFSFTPSHLWFEIVNCFDVLLIDPIFSSRGQHFSNLDLFYNLLIKHSVDIQRILVCTNHESQFFLLIKHKPSTLPQQK